MPSYTNGEWIDDPIVPDYRLRREHGFTSMLLVLDNYTFTCSGRLTTWYLWPRVNNVVSGCEVDFTLYVLRQNSTQCAPTQVARRQIIKQFTESESTNIGRVPEVIPSDQDVPVKAGDFIALQIGIGSGCLASTIAWLRGRVEPNSALIRRSSRQDEEYFACNAEPFSVVENALGFISAAVGEFITPKDIDRNSTCIMFL